jgi:hypothetical protein
MRGLYVVVKQNGGIGGIGNLKLVPVRAVNRQAHGARR